MRVGDVLVRDRPYVVVRARHAGARGHPEGRGERSGRTSFPCSTTDGKLVGIVSSDILRTMAANPDLSGLTIADDMMVPPRLGARDRRPPRRARDAPRARPARALFDGQNQMAYDAEDRVCAVWANGSVTQYLYDAEGRRVAKGYSASNPSALRCSTGGTDFVPTETYVLGQSGEQVTEFDGAGKWTHTNVYAAGQLLATYDTNRSGLHFHIADPLGSRRVQVSSAGTVDPDFVELQCANLPFGENLSCAGPGMDSTEHHFTGKERDSESGNDYFGPRYLSSSLGRFMSPDSVGAHLDDPQSLNKYSYVANNPLNRIDPDGHDWADGNEGALGFFGSSHSGAGSLDGAMRADMGGQHDNGAWLDSEQFDPFQYTYEGKNYATWDDWANYLISTPGAYDEAQGQFRIYTKNIQYNKAVMDYAASANVTLDVARGRISEASSYMEGGHWNFAFSGPDPRPEGKDFRVGGFTLHFPINDKGVFVHDDTVNPFPIWHGWNLVVHGVVDYVGGHTIFSDGFTF